MKPAPSLPNMKPKPTKKKSREPRMKSTKFFIRILTEFLLRVKPASQRANPGCIQKTSIAASSIQTVSRDIAMSFMILSF